MTSPPQMGKATHGPNLGPELENGATPVSAPNILRLIGPVFGEDPTIPGIPEKKSPRRAALDAQQLHRVVDAMGLHGDAAAVSSHDPRRRAGLPFFGF